jgi:hypothetical protein
MTNVEQVRRGFPWAESTQAGQGLQLEQMGDELHVTGPFPMKGKPNQPSHLIQQFERLTKPNSGAKKRRRRESPDVLFANADTDEKLLAFVQTFGPVVAKEAYYNFERPEKDRSEPEPIRVSAVQDLQELRNEQSIYHSAFKLIMLLKGKRSDYRSAQLLVQQIAAKIADWPRQWDRETSMGKKEPSWKLKAESLARIQGFALERQDAVSARIIVCELLNCFPSIVFANALEMHRSIKYGIRPLLYSLMRRQFLNPRDVGSCANSHCRNFFNVSRMGKKFCSPECSRHQRQRIYWQKAGKKLRKKRVSELKALSKSPETAAL